MLCDILVYQKIDPVNILKSSSYNKTPLVLQYIPSEIQYKK